MLISRFEVLFLGKRSGKVKVIYFVFLFKRLEDIERLEDRTII